ncbi:MAG: hypothetical protein LBH59_05170 [Planctomycetaceae bacterium]|jgi:hypothetical protein|nr:hypothetical protein [Planctomycetaceae bacterium]
METLIIPKPVWAVGFALEQPLHDATLAVFSFLILKRLQHIYCSHYKFANLYCNYFKALATRNILLKGNTTSDNISYVKFCFTIDKQDVINEIY